MIGYTDLFVALAEIAGVFVGFGALISVTRGGDSAAVDRALIRGVVLVGLLVMAGALIPVALERYLIEPELVWRVSGTVLLLLIWTTFLIPFRDPADWKGFLSWAHAGPIGLVVLLILEIAVQAPLALVVLGLSPTSSPALYTTALIINLLQAAVLLIQLVLSREDGAA